MPADRFYGRWPEVIAEMDALSRRRHGFAEAFVRTFRRYPLEDLRDAERRFRAHACRRKV